MKTREKNKMKIIMNKQILEGNTQVADNLPPKCASSPVIQEMEIYSLPLKKDYVIFKLKYKFLLLHCEIWNKHYFIENFCK